MKKYRQLIKELPSQKVVLAFGHFQPPTVGHELLVNAVKKIASSQGCDHVIFASNNQDKKSNPLSADRKLYYLNRMFPKTNFAQGTDENSIPEVLKKLNKKYKHIVVVSGSDKAPQYQKMLNDHNNKKYKFDSISVLSTGERDPDSDGAIGMNGVKMREAAKSGSFDAFKIGLPLSLTELDGKRLMNEVRQSLGYDLIKEPVKFETDELREKYFAGEIFNVGDMVESEGILYKIVKRGSNHLLVQDEAGKLTGKWPKDLIISENKFKDSEECNMGCMCSKCSGKKAEKVQEEVGQESDLQDKEIDDMVSSVSHEDALAAYEDNELALIDEHSGEHLCELQEELVTEVLSRIERIRARMRFAQGQAKRERRVKIALKTRSNTATLNRRARKLAIVMMKKRMAKRPLENLSVAEKERIEAAVSKNKKAINRIAMKLVPKLKEIENQRFVHKDFTK